MLIRRFLAGICTRQAPSRLTPTRPQAAPSIATVSAPKAADSRRYPALDSLRIVALALVAAQHILSLSNLDPWTNLGPINIGQLGVGTFLAISGLLAGTATRPPLTWLLQRFRRIYLAYWIAIAVSFVLTAIAGNKSFDLWQIVAQMLGIGLFTHPGRLINTPTWFVSLLFLCYIATAFARWIGYPRLVASLVAVTLIAVIARQPHAWLTQHTLTYTAATLAGLSSPAARAPQLLLLVGGCLVVAAWFKIDFAYAAISLVVLGLSLFATWSPAWAKTLADYSYEFYLVHGIALFGAIRYLPLPPIAAVVIGLLLAALAAVALHKAANLADAWLFRDATPPRPAVTT